MQSTESSVGDIIEARCTKCRTVTNHVIVTMAGSKPASVQCKTCHGAHRFRSPAVTPKTGQQANALRVVEQEEWDKLQTIVNNGLARDYDMDKEYRVGTVIKHQSLGHGLVKRIAGKRKMEVLFETGKKIMRCK